MMGKAHAITRTIADEHQAKNVVTDERICKAAIVGIGMRGQAGVTARMFAALAYNNINIQMISTSDIKIAVAIGITDWCSFIMGGCSQDETKIQWKNQVTSKADNQINAQDKIGLSAAFINAGNALNGKPG